MLDEQGMPQQLPDGRVVVLDAEDAAVGGESVAAASECPTAADSTDSGAPEEPEPQLEAAGKHAASVVGIELVATAGGVRDASTAVVA